MLSSYASTTHLPIPGSNNLGKPRSDAAADGAAIPFVRILPGLRAEELIATGRLILGLCLLLAVVGETEGGAQTRALTMVLLGGYSVVGAAIFVALQFLRERLLPHRMLIHSLDVVALAALLELTGGATSGYFSTLFFPIVAGALRWREAGALYTGAAVLGVFLTLSAVDVNTAALDLNTWLVRFAALIATVLILGQIRAIERRYATQILALANWPGFTTSPLPVLAKSLIERAAEVFAAPRALLLIEDWEEPWIHVFSWNQGALNHSRITQPQGELRVDAPGTDGKPYLIKQNASNDLSFFGADDSSAVSGAALPGWLVDKLDGSATLALPLSREGIRAHIFLIDPPEITADDLAVAVVLARYISDSLEQFRLTRELRMMTASEERVRLSRNLHDGVLQTLSGIALNLATVRQQYAIDEVKAHEQLVALEQLILDEQRDLRFFTDELRLQSGGPGEGLLFPDALKSLLDRLGTIWSVGVEWSPKDAEHVPARLCSDVYQLVHEAVVNSSRHGHATRITLAMSADAANLRIDLTDNGQGFSFQGRFSLAQMIADKRGPRSLRERVEELGGDLAIDSSPDGVAMVILLPFAEADAWQ